MNNPFNNLSAKVAGLFLTQPEPVQATDKEPDLLPPPPPTTTKPIEALLSAMGRALSQRYAEANMPMMVSVASNVRFKLDLISVHQTTENSQAISCIECIPPNILEKILLRQIQALPFAKHLDLTQFCGIAVIPAPETREFGMIEEVMRIGMSSVHLGFSFDAEATELPLAPTDMEGLESAGHTSQKNTAFEAFSASHFHLRMKQGLQGAWQDVLVDALPMVLGKDEGVQCQVEGARVSGKHAILDWDESLQCMRLTDRSTNGTYLGAEGSDQPERLYRSSVALIDKLGRFTLTNEPDAPVLEYWYGETQEAAQTTTTPMTSMTYVQLDPPQTQQILAAAEPTAPLPESPLVPQDPLAIADTALADASAQVTKMHSMAQVDVAAQSTKLSSMPMVNSSSPKALAMIQMRTSGSSDIHTLAITSLPFYVGREFAGAGLRVPEACIKVSRKHLMLDKQHSGGFYVDNLAHSSLGDRNGSYDNKAEQIKRFHFAIQDAAQDKGWLVLGAPSMDSETAEVRVVAA